MGRKQWMWVDWFLFSLRCGWLGSGLTYYYLYSEKLGELTYTNFSIFVFFGFSIPLMFWRPGYKNPTRYAISELIVTGGFYVYVNHILRIDLSTSIILMTILMIGYMMTERMAYWAIPLFVFLLPANRYWAMDNQIEFFLQYIDVFLFFGIGMGFNIITKSQKRYKQLLEENLNQYELIQQQNKALKEYAETVEEMALLEERNRMARDLHDSIGHYFTTVTVGLDAITYMFKSHPKMAEENIARLAEVSRTGLAEVRRTIHQIAPTETNELLSWQLEKLIRDFGVYTQTDIKFETIGTEKALPARVKLTLYRCLQESITNAKHHGEATHISVILYFAKDLIQLKVFNNGKKMETQTYGFGLRSMRERLEQLNGSLHIENVENAGMMMICSIPNGGNGG